MKNKFFTFFVLLLWADNSFSCDFCNNVNGINPYYAGKNRIAMTYLFQHSVTDATTHIQPVLARLAKISHSAPGTTSGSKEYRSTVDFSIFYHLSDHWAMSVSLPWQANRMISDQTITTAWTGDLTLMGVYRLDGGYSNSWFRFILIGAGLQLPTGHDRLEDDNGTRLPGDQQIGSGSWDVPLNLVWIQAVEKWTINADLFGKINGTNGFGERMGTSLSSSLSAAHDLYRDNPSGTAVIGLAGLRAETAEWDRNNGKKVENTGYSNLFLQGSLKLVWDTFRWNMTVLTPVASERPSGSPEEKTRFSSGVSWEWGE
ncbi:MAG: hypothetical protein J0L62_16570 [Bacteroidetes bacterium]|nr:hypothetical protein [Bacteroidota bacterium]